MAERPGDRGGAGCGQHVFLLIIVPGVIDEVVMIQPAAVAGAASSGEPFVGGRPRRFYLKPRIKEVTISTITRVAGAGFLMVSLSREDWDYRSPRFL